MISLVQECDTYSGCLEGRGGLHPFHDLLLPHGDFPQPLRHRYGELLSSSRDNIWSQKLHVQMNLRDTRFQIILYVSRCAFTCKDSKPVFVKELVLISHFTRTVMT